MARATAAEIALIIDYDSTNITDLTPFIAAASAVVDAHCTDITEATGTIVENWLAAHYLAIRDTRVASEKAGEVSQNYQYKLNLGLMCTHWGQTAMSLDDTGGLARWNDAIVKGKTGRAPTVLWGGTEATD